MNSITDKEYNIIEYTIKDALLQKRLEMFRPVKPLGEFLKEYSMAGGTQHAALVYGEVEKEIVNFGKFMEWNVVVL